MDRIIFRSAHVGEIKKLTFDFLSALALGETISTASVGAAVYSGGTATATLSTPSISGSQVTCTASGDTEGVTFLVTMTITTSAGQTLALSGFLAMVPAGL